MLSPVMKSQEYAAENKIKRMESCRITFIYWKKNIYKWNKLKKYKQSWPIKLQKQSLKCPFISFYFFLYFMQNNSTIKGCIDRSINTFLTICFFVKLYIFLYTMTTTWLGDRYEGEFKEGWYHGYGKLFMDNGIVYEGHFDKGQFHGEGKLIYPNGGYYKAKWEEGKMINGQYIFKDNLAYQTDNWKHCINADRRFYQEYLHGIKPSGATQQTREDKPHNIPTGTYDTGDGYYQPVKSIIYTYEGKIYRTPSEEEVKFIVEKCRYVSKAVDIDGKKDKVIKKVLELQSKK